MRFVLTLAAFLGLTLSASAQDWAKEKLSKSPRHGEYVKVKHGNREVQSFVVYPEVKEKATCVIVIHEIFGLSDWAKLVADEFAEAGYIAIAPDLLSGSGPNWGGTDELKGDVRKVISTLKPDQITADLKACEEYVTKLPASNGKAVVAGFCWGGSQSFRYATNSKSIKAALVFYGTGPNDAAEYKAINGPVYGFYGENDNRVNSTIAKSKDAMKKLEKTYEPIEYKGAGHGFMRAGEDPANKVEGNKTGREDAWKRIKDILKKI
ncbi:MAG: dienelactone hydrolase family protein [Gemmataceae bacterium]